MYTNKKKEGIVKFENSKKGYKNNFIIKNVSRNRARYVIAKSLISRVLNHAISKHISKIKIMFSLNILEPNFIYQF